MFLFQCCQQFHSGIGYEVTREKGTQFCQSLKDIKPKQLEGDRLSVRKIQRSQYEQIFKDHKKNGKQFIDNQFPAHQVSLGKIEGIQVCNWKRVSELVKDPILLGGKIEPNQVIQGSLGDCYFLSALAALAQNESVLRRIFDGQSYTSTGIYKVTMRVNGQLEEVVVDDFIPVNENNQPFFCQSYRNQFWMLILEKAWAKLHKSYFNIITGTPTSVFKTLTLAPADVFVVKQKNEQRQKIWNMINDYSKNGYPMVCSARQDLQRGAGIEGGHSYTLLGAAMLEDTEGTYHKIVKMRDPWSQQIWHGGRNEGSREFWGKIVSSYDRKEFQMKPSGGDSGIFYLPFTDFCQSFTQVHYCFLEKKPSYNSQALFVNKKSGSLYEFKVSKEGKYSFELHQSNIEEMEQEQPEGPCRSTLLIIKRNEGGSQFINGILKYSEEDAVLTQQLQAGNYLLFAKLDPTRSKQLIPQRTVVSVYSSCFTVLDNVQRTKYPDLLRNTFLLHAKGNKKNQYNNGLMWISWKLLLQQGGYAYVAMGVDHQSNKKFVIDFSEQEFNAMNFKLKGQFKGKGNQRIEVHPGQEEIILARVDNQLIKSLKFPPNLGIKMQLLQRQVGHLE